MRVQGVIDGARYDVAVGPGGAVGSVRVRRLVEQYAGREVKAGPTGPMLVVDPSDPRSVVALLAAKTRVTGTEGTENLTRLPSRPGVVR